MHELDDIALLRSYAEGHSEDAFAALVTRHIDKVYSVALRHAGNSHQAEEITQAVFVILAQKAKRLGQGVILEGWLYKAARLTALTFIRSEIRRARREQEAHMQSTPNEDEPDVWSRITPLLDSALAALNEADRNAVVLRFFYGKSMREIGAALGANEDTARMRVNRAVDRLRNYFSKHGVDSTAAAVSGAISVNSIQAAPAGLASSIATVAAAKGVAAGGSTLTLLKGVLKIMAWTKAKTAIVVGVSVLLAIIATTVVVKQNEARNSWDVWPKNLSPMMTLKYAPPQVRILPARFPKNGSYHAGMDGKMIGWDSSIVDMAKVAFASPSEHNWDSARIIVSPDVPQGRYDFIANLKDGSWLALQKEMERKLGVVGKRETRDEDVLLLTVKTPNSPGLKLDTAHQGGGSETLPGGGVSFENFKMSDFAVQLQRALNVPVVDGTDLPGNYDITVKWDTKDPAKLKQFVLDQLGLALVSTNMPIEMLVVERTR